MPVRRRRTLTPPAGLAPRTAPRAFPSKLPITQRDSAERRTPATDRRLDVAQRARARGLGRASGAARSCAGAVGRSRFHALALLTATAARRRIRGGSWLTW